jgi:hypothetical protein
MHFFLFDMTFSTVASFLGVGGDETVLELDIIW